MNELLQEKWSWIEPSHQMRTAMLDMLTDADLAYTPGGQAVTLGAVFREFGEIEHSYVQSLKTFKQNFDYRNTEAGLQDSVERLKAWFQTLDEDFKTTLSALEDANASIEREGGFSMPLAMQLDVYLQALMIFFGKAVVYFNAMSKPLPPSVVQYIA